MSFPSKHKIKILLFSIVILIITFNSIAQTYVTIPDPNFVALLQYRYPSCMNGNQMDTSCAGIKNETILWAEGSDISDFTGIQYFTNLQTFGCSGHNNIYNSLPPLPKTLKKLYCNDHSGAGVLTCLPILPDSLEELNCGGNPLTSFPTLPNTLKYLMCYKNQITSFPNLPNSINFFDCRNNLFTSLPPLPDSLRYFDCSNNHLTSLPDLPDLILNFECSNIHLTSLPDLPDSLRVFDCRMNQLTSLPALPDLLERFNCANNQLASLPALPDSLDELYCSFNQLTTLPTLPNSLKYFNCDNNQLTSLPALPNFLESFNCGFNQLTTLPTFPNSIQYLDCKNNQLTSLPTLPSLLEYFHCSFNQLTTLPILPNSIRNFDCKNNQLTSLPTLPNFLKIFQCSFNQLIYLPQLPNTLNYLSCNNNNISCFPIFPNSLYSLNISGNPYTCLPNYLALMDSATLSHPLCIEGDLINNPNVCTESKGILGKIYNDNSNDCVMDTWDQGLSNIQLKLYDDSNNLIAHTNSLFNGIYNFTDSIGTYNVKIDTVGMPFWVECLYPGIDSTVIVANHLVSNVNFAVTCKSGFDIGVQSVYTSGWVFPNLQHKLTVVAGDMKNWFNFNCSSWVSGQVQITVSGPVKYDGVAFGSLTPSVSVNTFTYNISDFGIINNSNAFGLLFTTDSTAQAGDQICVNVVMTPTNGDNNTINNNFQYCYSVVNSFDPNMKEVYPIDVETGFQDYFTYTIHFQNTGTAPAMNIRLLDTLNSNLDLETFQVINYSHYNRVSLIGNILTIIFPNIQLSDSTSNLEGSKGFVQYRIKPKTNLPLGTIVKNKAYIYFDYNPAIATNTTTNEYTLPVRINENNINTTLFVYPNPSNGKFYIHVLNSLVISELNIEVYNSCGKEVLNTKIQNNLSQIDLCQQPNGIYFFRIIGAKKVINQRVIKQ